MPVLFGFGCVGGWVGAVRALGVFGGVGGGW